MNQRVPSLPPSTVRGETASPCDDATLLAGIRAGGDTCRLPEQCAQWLMTGVRDKSRPLTVARTAQVEFSLKG